MIQSLPRWPIQLFIENFSITDRRSTAPAWNNDLIPWKMENHTQETESEQEHLLIPLLRYGCDDIWTWSRKQKSPEVGLLLSY